MRLFKRILWDMKFQFKYGFYFLYTILTGIYLVILFALPENWRSHAATLLIFSDPAAMGVFFMGAIVLLEKNQRVPCAFAVSPIRVMEYIVSKVVSICVISTFVAAALAIAAKALNLPLILLGTGVAVIIFTLLGIIAATRITSLNQFILWTVPVEAVGFLPAILHLFGISPPWLKHYPANICIDMVSGKGPAPAGAVITALLIAILVYITYKSVLNMWRSLGGGRL